MNAPRTNLEGTFTGLLKNDHLKDRFLAVLFLNQILFYEFVLRDFCSVQELRLLMKVVSYRNFVFPSVCR